MSVTPIRKDAAADKDADPRRAALREAIAEADKAVAAVVSQRAAIVRAEDLVSSAAAKCEAAGAAVDAARASHAASVADALKTSSEIRAPAAMKAARMAEADSQDELAAGNAALAKLTADLVDLEDAERWRRNDVVVAVNRVLAPVAARLLAEAADLKARSAIIMGIVGQLVSDDGGPRGLEPSDAVRARSLRDEPLDQIRAAVVPKYDDEVTLRERVMTAIAAWREAVAALCQDAGHQLPLPPA